ncbi:hypothetical protein O181_003654 [Austropuccinia psidii MF-1]|uniref:Major facilitator superfamily (MFS) profile domain-containing protein n=1 Tax=Austropuccinia psidii MF-1 TaxID=1389203 RepID=A0A9Q3BER6_9BASI|nr:hypothetical protein [Austropuccinia psidii MF-1]
MKDIKEVDNSDTLSFETAEEFQFTKNYVEGKSAKGSIRRLDFSYSGLLAARIFLGFAEGERLCDLLTIIDILIRKMFSGNFIGGMGPAIVLHLSSFYTRRELQLRLALYLSSASLAGAFSGLLAYGIIRLDGVSNLAGWSWIFILEGLFTSCFGILSFFTFPASIETNKFLTTSDKAILKERLLRDRPNLADENQTFSWSDIVASLTSVHVVINSISHFMVGTNVLSLVYFQPTIIKSLGFSEARTQLISFPPYLVAFVLTLVTAFFSDRYKARSFTAGACTLLSLAGFLMFRLSEPSQKSIKYSSLFLSISGSQAAVSSLNAWQANNSEGHYRRACSIAVAFVAVNLGGIFSTWIFPSSEKPQYKTGSTINAYFAAGILINILINFFWLRCANLYKSKNSDMLLAGYRLHDQSDVIMDFKEKKRAWAELGDRHPDFVYSY